MNKRSIAYIAMAAAMMNGIANADSETKKVSNALAKTSSSSVERVGYIDAFQVMRESDEGKLATKELEQKREALSTDVQKDYQAYMQAENEYKSKASTLKDAIRAQEEEKLVKMKRTLESKAKESEEELQMAMQRTTERLAKKVRETAAVVAQDLNLESVQDIMSGQVLYTSPKVTYTTQAVAKMNQAYKVELAQNKDAKKEVVASNKKEAAQARS